MDSFLEVIPDNRMRALEDGNGEEEKAKSVIEDNQGPNLPGPSVEPKESI